MFRVCLPHGRKAWYIMHLLSQCKLLFPMVKCLNDITEVKTQSENLHSRSQIDHQIFLDS